MMTRIFHPIGQGAFYTERFENFNVVYDCGTTKYKTIGEKVVKQSFKPTDEIEILFVSHFHEDHINGIKTLKEHCKSIKNVVLPLLDDIEKILLIKYYEDLGLQEEANLTRDSDSYFPDANVIYVKKGRDKQEENNIKKPTTIEEIINRKDKEDGKIEIESGTEIILSNESKYSDWCFVPYNHEYSERKEELEEEFKKNEVDVEEIEKSLYNELKKRDDESVGRRKIRKIYNSLEGNIHGNSMLLYSGPLDPKNDPPSAYFYLNCSLHYYIRYYMSEYLNRVGCIYTGDNNLNDVKIIKIFKDYLNNVGTIQIPHHGSIENFNEDFFDEKKKAYFCPISVGSNNSHGHPSPSVINSILFNNSPPIIISESLDSLFIQIINRY